MDRFTQEDKLSIKEILLDTEEYHLYYELAFSPPKGETVISKGEAAAIALAKTYNGIIASSNFRDVAKYARKYNLEHMGAGDILVAAFKAEYIDEAQKRLEEKEVLKADENNYIYYADFVLESLGIVDGVEVQKI